MKFLFSVWVLLVVDFDLSTACLPTTINFKPNLSSNIDKNNCGLVCKNNASYRTFDGSCNNLKYPTLGTAFSVYARLLNDTYTDDKNGMPGSNGSLPNPRESSLKLFPEGNFLDPVWTVMLMTWGQAVAHDLSHTANVPDKDVGICCSQGKYTQKEKSDPRCAAISLPSDDFSNALEGTVCYDFYRNKVNKRKNCKTPAYQPISSVTSYMDSSLVYGSDDETAKDLRENKCGKLQSKFRNGQEFLPQSYDVMGTCRNTSKSEPCYRAGDSRVNQNTLLTVLQTIFLRQHNHIAEELCSTINPQWNDERCYQEARKIFIALIQNINYYEYLPGILGQETMTKFKLNYVGSNSYVNDYNDTVDPTATVEFTSACFRYFHTTIPSEMGFYDENRFSTSFATISEWMNKPSIIEEGDNFDKLSRCLTTQPQYLEDSFYATDMKNYLFRNSSKERGQDLRALDFQRSRDHGLPYYIDVLRACSIADPKSFLDLGKLIPLNSVLELQKMYSSLDKVELVAAASLENLVPGALVGPTNLCILTAQFWKIRVGDRHFFENVNLFTLDQLKSIRNFTAARLMCDNVDSIEKMQPDVFRLISLKNSLVPCEKLPPSVNLSLWKEDTT